MEKVIAYYRCSTKDKQRYSLEAQRIEVEQFCKRHNLKIIASYQERISGQSQKRPELHKALQQSDKQKIPIIILRLDRLGRKASEVIDLAINNNIIIAEYGLHKYDRLTISIMATFIEKERELISKRTREGLRAAKARGVKLGSPKLEQIRRKASKKSQAEAVAFAKGLAGLFSHFEHLNNRELADNLNEWRTPTRKGGRWHPEMVRRIRKRIKTL